MGITGIFLLQLCVDYCQAWTEGLSLSQMFTSQGILVFIVKCMGLEKGLCLLTLIFYFSEGCCDYSWGRTERIFLSRSNYKTSKNYLSSGQSSYFQACSQPLGIGEFRGRGRQDCQLGVYESALISLHHDGETFHTQFRGPYINYFKVKLRGKPCFSCL